MTITIPSFEFPLGFVYAFFFMIYCEGVFFYFLGSLGLLCPTETLLGGIRFRGLFCWFGLYWMFCGQLGLVALGFPRCFFLIGGILPGVISVIWWLIRRRQARQEKPLG